MIMWHTELKHNRQSLSDYMIESAIVDKRFGPEGRIHACAIIRNFQQAGL